MKTILGLSMVLFFLLGSVAWAAPDYQGYAKWAQDHQKEIEEMSKHCNTSSTTHISKKCRKLLVLSLQAQCKYGINPEACKGVKEYEKSFK